MNLSNRFSSSCVDITRETDDCPNTVISHHINKIHHLTENALYPELTKFVEESLYITQSLLTLVESRLQTIYLNTISDAIKTLCSEENSFISRDSKLALLEQADKNYGRPALMLSGGGTFGIYHIGVVANLIENNLLPDVISGTSMGAIVAGILATHHDDEILELIGHPQKSNYKPLKRRSLFNILKHQSLLDETQLLNCIKENIGDSTFLEAYKKTGREVSITVSPSKLGQKPRILNHHTSPNVVIAYAAKASCSIPGLFPASQLFERNSEGMLTPYLDGELWYDGSFASDIPRQRISRLYNANFFIVSQANPHILPFISQRQKTGFKAVLQDIAISSIYAQGNALLKLTRRRFNSKYWSSWTNQLGQLFEQEYSGDINIHPNFPWTWYLKFMKNPSHEEVLYLHEEGKENTQRWAREIKEQTLISKTLRTCMKSLRKPPSGVIRELESYKRSNKDSDATCE